jgi:hypothetical protein
MKRIPTPHLWRAIAQIGMALAAGSFIMVAWLKLQPCPLQNKWGQTPFAFFL